MSPKRKCYLRGHPARELSCRQPSQLWPLMVQPQPQGDERERQADARREENEVFGHPSAASLLNSIAPIKEMRSKRNRVQHKDDAE